MSQFIALTNKTTGDRLWVNIESIVFIGETDEDHRFPAYLDPMPPYLDPMPPYSYVTLAGYADQLYVSETPAQILEGIRQAGLRPL